MVTAENVTTHDTMRLQHSRNMTIIRKGKELTLIHSVKLSKQGEKQLQTLGNVKHLMRLGSFHGRDDRYDLDHYNPTYWALDDMLDPITVDYTPLVSSADLPFQGYFRPYNKARFPEGYFFLLDHEGVVITCDSMKNWNESDPFFDEDTRALYRKLGDFGPMVISDTWLGAQGLCREDVENSLPGDYRYVISAHGPVFDQKTSRFHPLPGRRQEA